jgi:chromosome segregation ATPase
LKNILLLLVLLSGLISGYFIGDYRGRAAREALEKTIATGQSIDDELRTANTTLKAELAGVNGRHAQGIERLRADFSEKSAEWQHTKNGLDGTIRLQNARLVALNGALGELISQLGRSHGAEKVQLEQKIAILKNDIDLLLREVNGNACLKTQVPASVIETINGPGKLGSNR